MSFPKKNKPSCNRGQAGFRFSPSMLVLALSAALAAPGAANAADWSGAFSADWMTSGNWNPNAVPGPLVDIVIDAGGANPAVLDGNLGGSGDVNNITLGVTASHIGSMSVINGGVLGGRTGVIGATAGSTGLVLVDGTDSVWVNILNTMVGRSGSGSLTVSNGGTVSNQEGVIGVDQDSAGMVKVTGDGSKWSNSGDLTVGSNGAGVLEISNGGLVESRNGYIGLQPGPTGKVTVDGGASLWNNTTDLFVGQNGSGSLAITGSGTVRNVVGTVGNTVGSNGVVLVQDAGSTWDNSGDLLVGNGGSGTLKILNSGKVNADQAMIGVQASGAGVVAVDGKDAVLAVTGDLNVGESGQGGLSISNGGAVSAGGVVNVGHLAASNGQLFIKGGQLVNGARASIGGTLTATGAVFVDGPGSVWNNNGDLIVGDGGTGTLRISNGGAVTNVYGEIGGQMGSSGAVTVDGATSIWKNNISVTVGNVGSGALTVSNGGTVVATGALLGGAPGSAGVLNIGGSAGSVAVAPGNLNVPLINFGIGNAELNFNHTDTSGNYLFAAVISGQGLSSNINHNAGWTNLTGDSSGFTGQTNVNGGRLAVNGSLANSFVTVNNSGTLGGNGFVGGIQANAGGTVAPGNSIGILHVNGNVTQAAGSTYAVEVSAAQADLIDATGTATIEGGALLKPIKFGAAPLVLGAKYTVLQANGGVTGKYSLIGDSAFLGFSDSYDPTHAYLTVSRGKTFIEVGLTPNQKAAASGADGLGAGNVIYDAISMLPTDGAAQAAFDQLSGEIHPTVRSVQIEDSRFVRDASLDRLRSFDGQAASLTIVPAPEEGKPVDLPSTSDLTYWGRAMGGWGRIDSDGNAATVKRDTAGFLLGVDRMVNDDWRLGLVSGYSRSSFDVSERNSSGTSDNYHLGLYGGRRWGDLALRLGTAYTVHKVATNRTATFAGFSDSLQADYEAATIQAFGELGWRIKTGQAELEPFANVAHVNVSSDGFTERGGPAALTGRVAHSGVTFSTLGLRASSDFSLSGGTSMTARGSLGWRHAFGDTLADTGLSFGGGAPFVVYGVPIAKSAAVIEAGLDFKLTNAATLSVSYGGRFGSGLKDQSARVNLSVVL